MSIHEDQENSNKSRELSMVGIKVFFNISLAWNLTDEEQIILLGSPNRLNFYQWKRDPSTARLSRDVLERISYILGIYKALQILFPDPIAADGWVNKPNSESMFNGGSAKQRILSGNVSDLRFLRQYLEGKTEGYC